MIRRATLDDLPVMLRMGQHMHAESPRFSRMRFDAPTLERTLRALMSDPEHGFLWVGETASGVMAGMAAIAVPHWASTDLIATDLALFVEPVARGSLLPLRLVNRYMQWASDIGAVIRQLGVTTGLQTETTATLYERIGLKRCGVILEA